MFFVIFCGFSLPRAIRRDTRRCGRHILGPRGQGNGGGGEPKGEEGGRGEGGRPGEGGVGGVKRARVRNGGMRTRRQKDRERERDSEEEGERERATGNEKGV